LKPWGNRSPY